MDFTFSLKLLGFYKSFVFISYILIFLYVVLLSREVSFQQVNPSNASKISFSLDFCYELSIRGETCKPSYSAGEIDKLPFPDDCQFERPIECYTKGFRHLSIGEILQKFNDCQIENLVQIDRPAEVSYKLL